MSEIYFNEKEKPKSLLEFSKKNIIVFNSLSKRSNMPNYRIGLAAGDKKLVEALRKIKTRIDSGQADFIQEAAIAALSDEKHVEEIRREYKKRRDIIVQAFVEVGLKKCEPKATFYIWQEIPQDYDSIEFAKLLLEKASIVTLPGAFVCKNINGVNAGDKFIRLALIPDTKECEEAAEKIKKLQF